MATTQSAATVATQSAAPAAAKTIEYLANGHTVKLSAEIVRNFLTKGNGNVSDQDIVQFINICKFNQLNPFLNEAYLIKFGTQPAQMIVSKEALMKRAETNENYDGIAAGVIVKTSDGKIEMLEGSFYDDDAVLVGGWAKVFRRDRKNPFTATVRLSEYDKKQSIWNTSKSTMIRKVAVVQAMREAFPVQLGAMYTEEEQKIQIQDTTATVIDSQPHSAPINGEINIPDESPAMPQPSQPSQPAAAPGQTVRKADF